MKNISNNHIKNFFVLMTAIIITLSNMALSYTKLSVITSYIPFSFLLLFLLQKNKRQRLTEVFNLKDWKKPLFHILISIIFACLCISSYQLVTFQGARIQFLLLIIFLLAQAFNEEYIYRYFCLTYLNCPITISIIISSLIFTAMHYLLPQYQSEISIFSLTTFLLRFLLGILFSLFYIRDHSIYEVTLLHFLYDIVTILKPEDSYLFTAFLCALIVFEKKAVIQLWIKNIKDHE